MRCIAVSTAALAGSVLVAAGPSAAAGSPAAGSPATGAPDRTTPTRVAASTQGPLDAGRYVVQLADEPLAAYEGGVAGLAATRPVEGDRSSLSSAAAADYRDYLDGQQQDVLDDVRGVQPVYDYRTAFNGFAAELTAEQAEALAKDPGVLSVSKDELYQLDTSRTPGFLGLDAPGGAWEQLGGPGAGGAGDGVVVGIIDSGIWPESDSFAALPGDPAAPQDWQGTCQTGEEFAADDCSSKLIGARYFVDGFGADQLAEEEYLSPRDGDGHGSHTASTAAGNSGVRAVVEGTDLGVLSGMAPNARVAAYKTCWTGTDSAGCAGSDNVAAIEAAVEDGVDVLNFSISGSLTSALDPTEVAFLFAADAGVFVAASAGNSGPGASTVAHNSPWLTTVAAGTHDRTGRGSVTLGNGVTYAGTSITGGVASSPLVLSAAAALSSAPAADAALCFAGTLDPARTAGKVVVCDRGVSARTDKGVEVRRAGGVGMVLVNTSPSSLNADLHVLPTVHLDEVAGAAVKAYAATAGATAAIAPSEIVTGVKAPEVAAFSSRGPALASGDLLKPDIMAPGVDVLAAVAPPSGGGRSFDFYSGTSMSSPHIAGIAALYVQAHPTWSPMMVKSAMMTTATTVDNTGATIAGGAFAYGAGHVRPTLGLSPGLVFDSGFDDWLGYLCGTEYDGAECAELEIDPSDLNTPSIAVGQLVGQQTVTRTLTNVSGSTQRFTSSLSLPRGVRVKVVPSSFTIADGASQTVEFILTTRPDTALGSTAQGSVTWRSAGGAYAVRSPIVATPVALAAPTSLYGTGATGSVDYRIGAGYTGPLAAEVDGLVAAQESTGQALAGGEDATFTVEVPEGAELARFAMFDRDVPAGTDLDLFVSFEGRKVGVSAGGTTDETVDLTDPEAGTYTVVVDAFGLATGQTSVTPRVFTWALGSEDAGNLDVDVPATLTRAQTYDVTASWSGLDATRRYLGEIEYRRGTEVLATTLLQVDADA